MTPRSACVVVLAKMALEDGALDGKEGRLLQRLCDRLGLEREAVEKTARERHLAEVLEQVETAPDRMVIQFHAFLMANIDGHFDDWEHELYDVVSTLLALPPADQAAMERHARHVLAGKGMPPEMSKVVASSSFRGM